MTLDEFFAALERTPRDWVITERGEIRRMGYVREQCPVTAVAGFGEKSPLWQHGDPSFWRMAAHVLELGHTNASNIVGAADRGKSRSQLRTRLLASCGLDR